MQKKEENNQSPIILPSVWLMVRLFFNRWAHEQFVVALVAEEVIRSVSFSKEKRISMKLRILISIFYFIWSLHEIFRFKKLSWIKILGKWTLDMGILVKTVRIHVSRILLQTREIWYEKCDSTILRKKREKKQSNWALH